MYPESILKIHCTTFLNQMSNESFQKTKLLTLNTDQMF